MKNQNKILLSLVTASVSALAAAPYLLKEKSIISEKKSIDISVSDNFKDMKKEDVEAKKEIKSYVDAVLTKKSAIINIGKNINVVSENYANIKSDVLVELGAGYDPTINDDSTGAGSTLANPGSISTVINSTNGVSAFCHTACHGVCHGARGWR